MHPSSTTSRFSLAGFLLCDVYLSRKDWSRSFVWDGLALCGWPLVWYMGLNSGHVVLPFVIVVLYLAAFRGKVCSAIFSNRVITDIGGMCYSIYRFHSLVTYAVKHQTWPFHIGQNFWVYYTTVRPHHSVGAAVLRELLPARGTAVHGSGVAEETVECARHAPDQPSDEAGGPRIDWRWESANHRVRRSHLITKTGDRRHKMNAGSALV